MPKPGYHTTKYRCLIEKRILQNAFRANYFTALCYELKPSDFPEVGAELQDGRWFSGPLTRVIWSADDELFYCRVEDEQPFTQGSEEFDHDWLVDNYLQLGWFASPSQIKWSR